MSDYDAAGIDGDPFDRPASPGPRFTLSVLDDAETVGLCCGRCPWLEFLSTECPGLALDELNRRAREHAAECR